MKKIFVPFFVAVSLILSACSFDNKLMAFISSSIEAIPVEGNPEDPVSDEPDYSIKNFDIWPSILGNFYQSISKPEKSIVFTINSEIGDNIELVELYLQFNDTTNLKKIEVYDSNKNKLNEYTVFLKNKLMEIYTLTDLSKSEQFFYLRINGKKYVEVCVEIKKYIHVCLDPDTITVENVTRNGNLTVDAYQTTKDGNPCWRVTVLCPDSVDSEDAVKITFERGLPAVFYMNNVRDEKFTNIINGKKIKELFESPLELKCAKDNTTMIIDAVKISDWEKTTIQTDGRIGDLSFYSGFSWGETAAAMDYLDLNFENDNPKIPNAVSCSYYTEDNSGYFKFTVPYMNTKKIYPSIKATYKANDNSNFGEPSINIGLYSVDVVVPKSWINIGFNTENNVYLTLYLLSADGSIVNFKNFTPCSITLRNNIK